MSPSELDKKLFLVTEHELQYKNGIPTEISSVLDGELKAEGGVIKIKAAGSYTFSAASGEYFSSFMSLSA